MSACDIAVLSDHDDVWHADRVAHQAALLDEHPDVSLLASDGRLVDETGRPLGGTLRDTFRVPSDFNDDEPGGPHAGGPAEVRRHGRGERRPARRRSRTS